MIVVTGGAGFIGSAFVCETERRGDRRHRHRRRAGDVREVEEPRQAAVCRLPPQGCLPPDGRGGPGSLPGRGHRPHGGLLLDDGAGRRLPHGEQFPLHLPSGRLGAWRTGSASSTPAPRRPTATARRASPTTTKRPAALRPINMYGYSKQLFDLWVLREGIAGPGRGDQVLQRLRSERVPQGRHDERDLQGLPPDPRDGQGPAFQILPAGISPTAGRCAISSTSRTASRSSGGS